MGITQKQAVTLIKLGFFLLLSADIVDIVLGYGTALNGILRIVGSILGSAGIYFHQKPSGKEKPVN